MSEAGPAIESLCQTKVLLQLNGKLLGLAVNGNRVV